MKKVESTWIYIIGTLVLFGIIVLFATDQFLPRLLNRVPYDSLTNIKAPSNNYLNVNLDYLAKITTNKGIFNADLYESTTPKNVTNFAYLSSNKFYNNTTFHRLVPNFIIQGGDRNTLNNDPKDDGLGKTTYFIEDEVNWDSLGLSQEKRGKLEALGYKSNSTSGASQIDKYSIVMANSGPNTNSSQFFITLIDANDPRIQELVGQYTVIGKVIDGFDIIDLLANTSVDNPESENPRPQDDLKILSIEIYSI